MSDHILVNESKSKKKCCSLWLVTTEWQQFQQNTMKVYGKKKSASDRINEFMKSENLKSSGQSSEISLDNSIAETEQSLLASFAASTKLGKMWSQNGEMKVVYNVFDFAHRCGIPKDTKEESIESIITQLSAEPNLLFKLYNATPDNSIDASTLEIFIQYIEEKLKQTVLGKRISELRNKRASLSLEQLANAHSSPSALVDSTALDPITEEVEDNGYMQQVETNES